MNPSKIEQLFTDLEFDRDDRFPPDRLRRAQFRAGWEEATTRTGKYSAAILRRLTWRNLGYRFGQKQGPRAPNRIDGVYEVLAQRYGTFWIPRSPEDHLLQHYWMRVGGRIYVDVPIGRPSKSADWPPGSGRRRLDGVRLPDAVDSAIVRFSPEAFLQRVQSEPVELVEVKISLNRPVIRQAIAGRHMYTRQYAGTVVRSVIVCRESDSALEGVCQQQNIAVEVVAGL